jgi:hypothetical protein
MPKSDSGNNNKRGGKASKDGTITGGGGSPKQSRPATLRAVDGSGAAMTPKCWKQRQTERAI